MITFAIPFYRDVELLRRAVASVQAQSVSSWRLVISDEGVEPGVAEWVDSLGDPRITHRLNPAPLGMAGNWNRCLRAGARVCILHADDELLPTYAALMLAAFQEHPQAVACYCRARVVDRAGRERFSWPDWIKGWLQPAGALLRGEPGARALLRGNFIMCPTLCYQSARLGELQFSARWKMVLDLDFTLRLLLGGGYLVALPAVAYAYRRHAGNATREYTRSGWRFSEEIALHQEMALVCAERGWTRAARMARWRPFVRLHLGWSALGDLLRGRFALAWRKLAML